jgi:hypothetical protein
VRYEVLDPWKTLGKIMILDTLVLMLLETKWEDKSFWTKWWQALLEFNPLLTPYRMVGHIWHNPFFLIFEGLLMLVTLLYTLVKWFVF